MKTMQESNVLMIL